MECKMGGFGSVLKGRTAGERRRSAGRWGNLALIAVHCPEVWQEKPMHHTVALSKVHSYD